MSPRPYEFRTWEPIGRCDYCRRLIYLSERVKVEDKDLCQMCSKAATNQVIK